MSFLRFLAQKASKVIISLFSRFWDSSMKMRGSFFSEGGTQSWPGTAIVNHPLRLQYRAGLSYFPYIFYFVNFTISAAIRQGLFGSFENVIKDFRNFGDFWKSSTFCVPGSTSKVDSKSSIFGSRLRISLSSTVLWWFLEKSVIGFEWNLSFLTQISHFHWVWNSRLILCVRI